MNIRSDIEQECLLYVANEAWELEPKHNSCFTEYDLAKLYGAEKPLSWEHVKS